MLVSYEKRYIDDVLRAVLPLNKNGRYEGIAKFFNESGVLVSEVHYTQGRKLLERKFFTRSSDKYDLCKIFDLDSGRLDCKILSKNNNSVRSHKYSPTNKALVHIDKYLRRHLSHRRMFNENGLPTSESLYHSNGNLHITRFFWENGVLKNEVVYGKNGILILDEKCFDREGNLLNNGASVA